MVIKMDVRKSYHICGCVIYVYAYETGERINKDVFFSERGRKIKNCPGCGELLDSSDIFPSLEKVKKFNRSRIKDLEKETERMKKFSEKNQPEQKQKIKCAFCGNDLTRKELKDSAGRIYGFEFQCDCSFSMMTTVSPCIIAYNFVKYAWI